MTKDEFLTLPGAQLRALLYDLLEPRLVALGAAKAPPPPPRDEPPQQSGPLSPRFDARIPRRAGFFQWASETLLESLEWWHAKKKESAGSGGQYAEKDAKLAGELERFIAWRRSAPGERWSGTRGDERVTAELPSRDPTVHSWA